MRETAREVENMPLLLTGNAILISNLCFNEVKIAINHTKLMINDLLNRVEMNASRKLYNVFGRISGVLTAGISRELLPERNVRGLSETPALY